MTTDPVTNQQGFLEPPFQVVVFPEWKPGEKIRDDCEILEKIGEGTFGVVYKAKQSGPNRLVAIKSLRPRFNMAVLSARFDQEAEAMGQFQDKNIVHIYFTGRHFGQPYICMEYCGRGNLKYNKPANFTDLAELGVALASAIARLHSEPKKWIHRDLKPGNILFTDDGTIKVGDLGLAKLVHAGRDLTHSGEIPGTPSYMAPEQKSGESSQIDAPVDIYAIGLVLFECVIGRLPKPDDILSLHEGTCPKHDWGLLGTLTGELQENLWRILLGCLQHEPGSRLSASTLLEELQTIRERVLPRGSQNRFHERNNAAPANHLSVVQPAGRALCLSEITPSGTDVDASPGRRLQFSMRTALFLMGVVGVIVFAFLLPKEEGTEPRLALSFPDSPRYSVDECYVAEFSPDAKQILVTGAPAGERAPGSIKVLDAAHGKLIRRENKADTDSWLATFSAPGTTIIQAGRLRLDDRAPGFVNIWKWDHGALHFQQSLSHSAPVRALALSPNARFLASGGDSSTVIVWDITNWKEVDSLPHGIGVQALSFSPDSTFLASACEDGFARVWDLSGKKAKRTGLCKGHEKAVLTVIWNRDTPTFFSAGLDRTIREWDYRGKQIRVVATSKVAIGTLALSPNGRYLLSGDDVDESVGGVQAYGLVRAWDLSSGALVASLSAHRGKVKTLRFSSDGLSLLTSGPAERSGRLWESPNWLRE